jgi:DNA-binding NarL/FixJ family response regulator
MPPTHTTEGLEAAREIRRASRRSGSSCCRRRRAPSALDELTRREHEVLGLMAEGRSNHAIAEALGLETKTVEGHVRTIFSKLGLEPDAADHRRVMAVLTYLKA